MKPRRSAVVGGLLLHVRFVISQYGTPSSKATCVDDYKWMFNSKDQSPCLVAAYLQATCFNNEQWEVQSLGPGTFYLPPEADKVNPCQCNTVTYNMLSACGACQKQGWVGWKAWIGACPSGVVQVQNYPFSIPGDTALPQWAYLDTSAGTFDVNQAYKVATNSTSDFINPTPERKPHVSAGFIVSIVAVGILLIGIPLMFLFFRCKSSRNTINPNFNFNFGFFSRPKRSTSKSTIEGAHTPVRMKSIWLGDAHAYSPIQKRGGRLSGSGGPSSLMGKLKAKVTGKDPAVVSSARPTSKFEIDRDTVIDVGRGGDGDGDEDEDVKGALLGEGGAAAASERGMGMGHRQQPSAGAMSSSSWQSFLRLNQSKPQVEQHEDIGSAVDFTFVESTINAKQRASEDEEDGVGGGGGGPGRDPSPQGRGPYSWWSRNPPHRYPPISRRSTLYPSDSISNLQLRENLDDDESPPPDQAPAPPTGNALERREWEAARRDREAVERAKKEREAARREEETRKALAALEGLEGGGVMSPVESVMSSIHTEKYSPPPHRSRLPQMRSSDPVMMYPGTVRGNVPHTPTASR